MYIAIGRQKPRLHLNLPDRMQKKLMAWAHLLSYLCSFRQGEFPDSKQIFYSVYHNSICQGGLGQCRIMVSSIRFRIGWDTTGTNDKVRIGVGCEWVRVGWDRAGAGCV